MIRYGWIWSKGQSDAEQSTHLDPNEQGSTLWPMIWRESVDENGCYPMYCPVLGHGRSRTWRVHWSRCFQCPPEMLPDCEVYSIPEPPPSILWPEDMPEELTSPNAASPNSATHAGGIFPPAEGRGRLLGGSGGSSNSSGPTPASALAAVAQEGPWHTDQPAPPTTVDPWHVDPSSDPWHVPLAPQHLPSPPPGLAPDGEDAALLSLMRQRQREEIAAHRAAQLAQDVALARRLAEEEEEEGAETR